MTEQIIDEFHYRNERYMLAGINGWGYFDSKEHGLSVVPMSTACWRGVQCFWEVSDRSLYLSQVILGLSREDRKAASRGEGPKLFGKVPHPSPLRHGNPTHPANQDSAPTWQYSDLRVNNFHELLPFSGGLLLANEYDPGGYVSRKHCQHRAYNFRVVYELIFEDGRQIEEYDRSGQMAEFREKFTGKPANQVSIDEVRAWENNCFTLEYESFMGYLNTLDGRLISRSSRPDQRATKSN